MSGQGWIGVDLDGTLAEWGPPYDVLKIGRPIPAMTNRVRAWLAEGQEVRIVTARVGPASEAECGIYAHTSASFLDHQRTLIGDWSERHLGQRLLVTATKDFAMTELWDDRAVQVQTNTGATIHELLLQMIAQSAKAWQVLGYKPGDAPGYDLAEAIRRRITRVEIVR